MERFSPGQLLDPRHEVVPLRGRSAELAALRGWRDEHGGRRLMLLHGRAGVGKTRLVARLDDVTVLDDADLLPWHDLLARFTDGAVVLLARTAGWWWSAIRQRAEDLGFDTADLELTPCPREHEASYTDACLRFAHRFALPVPDAPTPAAETFHDLHLAALAAVHGRAETDRVELVRWLGSVDPMPPATRRQAEDALAVTLLDDRIAPERSPAALETLARAARRWPHVLRRAEELFTAEPALAATASSAALRVVADSPAPARAVARHVFDDPRFHRDPLPAMLTRTLLHEGARTAETPELAELYGMLSARAALASLKEEALEAATEEVALYRELAEADPAEHRGGLADALGDLGLRLVAVKATGRALATAEEAVEIYRDLTDGDPDYLPRLAAALEQVGVRYAATGRREDALHAVDEAAHLYEDLVDANGALFRIDFAKAAHHLAIRLFDLDRDRDATHAAHLAMVHWRSSAESDPRYEPEFARTLVAIAAALAEHGRPDDAIVVLEEASGVLRRLADANPRVFETELASALAAASVLLLRADRSDEARKAADEVVLLRRKLAAEDPAGRPALAAALVELVTVLTGPDRYLAAEDAVDLLRELDFPREALNADLADALRDQSVELVPVDPRRASELADLEVDVRRELDDGPAYAEAVLRTAMLRGATPEGLAAARMAVLLWHGMRTADELTTEPRYADALSCYARLCARHGGRLDGAMEVAHRAVMVLRAANASRDRFEDAVHAAETVIRAHPDQESARARMQALVVRDWPAE
ncbi:hypothetical protein [Saccharothrix violaceirubra]|uniref:Tetratricopeptide repeat protein n=1 Tax=Saccharothrix violaceirubra TaxID=413306 RepID=A0A7W7T7K0_9PSEU|nr:hypothetical protein [Saccharothrix violaceirubra]MBB4968047.1 hypothetical protein [Saccharothrix violaceirubra]